MKMAVNQNVEAHIVVFPENQSEKPDLEGQRHNLEYQNEGKVTRKRNERCKKFTEKGMGYQLSLLESKKSKLTSRLLRKSSNIKILLYSVFELGFFTHIAGD